MSTWSQWWLSFKKSSVPRQITWICGTEPVLIDEVVSLITSAVNPDEINHVYLDARELSERAIWNELRQLPFGTTANRLTVVYGAEKLKNDALFQQYIKDKSAYPRNYAIFVSGEEGARRSEDKKLLWEPLEYLKTRGSTIECKAFTSATAKHAVAWVKEKANIRGGVAEFLLNRATGDLRIVRDTVAKLSAFPGEISLKVVSDMFAELPKDTFLGALFSMDKKTAMHAISEIPRGEYSKTLGLVDARLELAGNIHDMMIQKKSHAEIARAAGNKGFLVPEMLPVAKHYDKKRRTKIREYLATVDEFSAYGIPDGALEGLVSVW